VWGAEEEMLVVADRYWRVANGVVPILSVAGNAAIEPAVLLAAYDVSAGGPTGDLGARERPVRGVEGRADAPAFVHVGQAVGDRRAACGGHHGGDELTFKLTRPRYKASRGTVSYQLKQINNGRLPSRAGRAAQDAQQFGAASLSIVGAPQAASLTAAHTYYECLPPGESVAQGCWGTVTGSGLQPNQLLNVTLQPQ
jgi:hypothetical protein